MRFDLALVIFLAAAPAETDVIERVLAVVGGRPVTLTEVELFEAVRGVDRKRALEAVIDSRLMFQEAFRLPQVALSAEEEDKAFQSLAERGRAAGNTEAELRALARREAIVLKYIAFRFSSRIRIADEELAAAYQAEYGGREDAPDFDTVAAVLKSQLEARELDQQIEAWVRELRDNVEIRYNP